MAQLVTFATVLSVGFSLLIFLAKTQFNDIKNSIKENNENTNKRIEKLENKTDAEIGNIKQELNDIKGDFATTFVLREDFFRSMNGVEDRMKSIDAKIDKLLMRSGNNEGKGG